MLAGVSASPAGATIYYVSPTGNDLNSGTSPTSPWGSVAKVDSTNFQPGDQILFQYGSSWNASLDASSSGSVAAPIVYGAYGNPSLGNPTFVGADPISNSVFTPYKPSGGSIGNVYVTTLSTPPNWVYLNSTLMHEAGDADGQGTGTSADAENLSAVTYNPNFFYYNSSNGQLFVNTGSASLNAVNLSIGDRQDAIYSNGQSNLIFRNLSTSDTALDNAGYGVRVQFSSNVQLMNLNVSNFGKHGVGLIDATGVNVTNVVASNAAPDQGFGGSSAFVSFGDAASGAISINNTSVYTNDSYINANGPYPAFISHGGTNGVASVTLNNMSSVTGTGVSGVIYITGSSETATVNGGNFDGTFELDTNNSVINGASFQGSGGRISLGGSNTVVQNTVLNGVSPDYFGGTYASIVDNGSNNTVRFNVINESFNGPAVASTTGSTNTSFYGNIITNLLNPGTDAGVSQINGTVTSNYNLYAPGTSFLVTSNFTRITAAQWIAMGEDANSIFANAAFNNSSAGDFSLASTSTGLGLVPGPLAATNATADALLGPTTANGTYNAGLNPFLSGSLNLINTPTTLGNGQMTVLSPAGGTLSIQPTGLVVVLTNSSIDLAGNVKNSGAFIASGSLNQTGNFTNSGSFYISGAQTWSPLTVFTNTGGNAIFASDAGGPIAPVGYLTVNVSGGSVVFATTQHVAGINVLAGGTLQVASHTGAAPLVITTPSLSVVGTLDLTNNDLIVQGGTAGSTAGGNLAAVTAMVKSGYNQGRWNGSGIVSSTAAADSARLTSIGVIQNSVDGFDALYGQGGSAAPFGLFDGADPNNTDVLVKFTYYGDTNLDGTVDGTDYSRLDNGFIHHLTGWYNGDFNYDGIINGSDYTLIDNAFNGQGASLTGNIANPQAASTAQIAVVPTAVPEPSAVGVDALLTLPLLRRRKRRWQR